MIQYGLGVSQLISEASVTVEDSSERFTQPNDHRPDKVQVGSLFLLYVMRCYGKTHFFLAKKTHLGSPKTEKTEIFRQNKKEITRTIPN